MIKIYSIKLLIMLAIFPLVMSLGALINDLLGVGFIGIICSFLTGFLIAWLLDFCL